MSFLGDGPHPAKEAENQRRPQGCLWSPCSSPGPTSSPSQGPNARGGKTTKITSLHEMCSATPKAWDSYELGTVTLVVPQALAQPRHRTTPGGAIHSANYIRAAPPAGYMAVHHSSAGCQAVRPRGGQSLYNQLSQLSAPSCQTRCPIPQGTAGPREPRNL